MSSISLSIVPEKQIIRNDDVSEFDLLIDLQAEALADPHGKPLSPDNMNFSIALDRSGSMQGDKLSIAKEAASKLRSSIRQSDTFSLIVFDQEAHVLVAAEDTKDEALQKISEIQTGGMTNILLGWYMSVLELQKQSVDHRKIIILSDGLANSGITKLTEIADESKKAFEIGISTSAIGVGSDCDQDFLEALSANSGGHFAYADESTLAQTLEDEIDSSQAVVVPRPSVVLDVPDGLEISQEFHAFTRQGERLRLNPISAGEKHCLAFRIKVSAPSKLGDSVTFTCSLFAGNGLLTSEQTTIPTGDISSYVEAEETPLVSAFIAQFLATNTDEEAERAAASGDFALASSLMIQEIEGIKVARDRLAERSDARHSYEGERMRYEYGSKLLSFVMHDLKNFFMSRGISSDIEQRFDDAYFRFQKMSKMSTSSKKSRRKIGGAQKRVIIEFLDEVENIFADLDQKGFERDELQRYRDMLNEARSEFSE